MEWISENWYLLVALIAVITAIVVAVVKFFKLPTAQQIANVKRWLEWAVTEAEKELGGGTGQLKLRMVYDMAIQHFPWIIKFVSFDTFAEWVDEALEWMKTQLAKNEAIKQIVNKEEA